MQSQLLLQKSVSITSINDDLTIAKPHHSPCQSIPLVSKTSSGVLKKEKLSDKDSSAQSKSRIQLHFDFSQVKNKDQNKGNRSMANSPPKESKLLRQSTQASGNTEMSPLKAASPSRGISPAKVFSVGDNKFKITTTVTTEHPSPFKKSENRFYKTTSRVKIGDSILSRVTSPSPTKTTANTKSIKFP